ncbi:putative acetyltransferase [Pengzhenrongella sicca]|uniref:Histone acetyltransferase Rv0428c-like SH3 domain-containing protein n=1 Tax=Pengzhenrongella sicca TaxID=2819238 RepID=A0A8A4ZGP3_9MICO|nr:hypothetical protein [Pengzhenrongella sicca]QTE28818.1 hypothetical protein J4E96_16005 [Pengzhenrongella sicca]
MTTTVGPTPAPEPWRAWPTGTRVVVRRRLSEGGYSDVLGEVLASDGTGVRIETRRGPVHVPAADIALGKVIPPAPPRRAPRQPD